MNKNTKKIMTMVIAVAMVAAMAACGSSNDDAGTSSEPVTPPASDTASSLPEVSEPAVDEGGDFDATAQMFAGAITGARNADMNDAFDIFTHDEGYNMTTFRNRFSDMKKEDGSAYTEDEMLESHGNDLDMRLQLLGINKDDVESYAISISPMNTQAYGVAIVKPVAGKEDAVKTAMEGFVTTQQKNFENYLPDQYEIAKAGYVKTLEDGTLVMVVSEDQDTVYESITKGLTDNASATDNASTTEGSSVAAAQ